MSVTAKGGTDTANGVGNLIVGYGEEPDPDTTGPDFNGDHTGSHNLVVGAGHTWTGNSGIVAGELGILEGDNAAIIGGHYSKVLGVGSVSLGADSSTASGEYSAVVGTQGGQAKGDYSGVIGGRFNTVESDGVGSVNASGSNQSLSGAFQFEGGWE